MAREAYGIGIVLPDYANWHHCAAPAACVSPLDLAVRAAIQHAHCVALYSRTFDYIRKEAIACCSSRNLN